MVDAQGSGEPRDTAVHGDAMGRIRVRFDEQGRLPAADGHALSSIWGRVAQVWASSNVGAQFMPRLGQYVLVDFINGERVIRGQRRGRVVPALGKLRVGGRAGAEFGLARGRRRVRQACCATFHSAGSIATIVAHRRSLLLWPQEPVAGAEAVLRAPVCELGTGTSPVLQLSQGVRWPYFISTANLD